ncbi:MAG: carbamoyltransferase HypF, partial [Planctomycetes bacterium]|nr:carbamoyltransferase HypF [Planctomycetota bacterium]
MQGVGFRPTVHRLASELGLGGSVQNDADGATIEIEGSAEAVRAFGARLSAELPPLARLDGTEEIELAPRGERAFAVEDSVVGPRRRALVPPDAKLCDACRAELDDPSDRRHAYPFTTCTHCGPRFTLVTALPYDRERTSMARFPLCARCATEYADPRDRRFHAEPTCCADCGPRIALEGPDGELHASREHALGLARAALASGCIVAVQGLGGFQLACLADDSAVLRRLRAEKRRPHRPFAVMVRDLATARELVVLRHEDERLLASPRAPILLAPRRESSAIAAEVAPESEDVGVLLPTTPLHVELFRAAPYRALVMTSGNLHDEPICRTVLEARTKLRGLADFLLIHEREIVRRCDDSVVRTMPSGHALVRRSRGYVPEPIALPLAASEPVLALGGHLQNAVALAVDGEAFPSQHVGDLDTEPARAFQTEVASGLEAFLAVEPRVFAVDLHPDYASTWLGERLAALRGGRVLRVQHHLAHAAATLGEHGAWPGEHERVGALVLVGTGFGAPSELAGDDLHPDAWGAEWL